MKLISKYKFLLVISFGIFWFYSCERKTEWEIDAGENQMVVECMITNEYKKHEIKLTWSKKEMTDSNSPISGSDVSIFDGEKVFLFYENPLNSGIYISDSLFSASVGKTYQLSIKANDKIYSAMSEVEPVTPLDDVQYSLDQTSGLFYISKIGPTYDDQSALYQVNLNWTMVNYPDSISFEKDSAQIYGYTLPTLDVNQIFPPVKDRVYFPMGTLIKVRKYSLTDKHAEYVRALVAESQWRGGYFDVAAAGLPTNMSPGAVGYFAVSTVIEKNYTVTW